MAPQQQGGDQLEELRRNLCSLLDCGRYCPQAECSDYIEAVGQATQLAEKILQVLEEWERATPWPD